MKIKKSVEDYLRIMYKLDKGGGVRNIDVSKELKISKASVSEMLRKLARKKLVKTKPYSKVLLTEEGEGIAEKLFKKHRISKMFMQKVLGYDEDEANKYAHELEHSFSLEAAEKIEKFMEGKPISLPRYVG